MREAWTGELIGVMHNEQITRQELANELGVGKAYVTMLLNGQRDASKMRERMEAAVKAILQRRKEAQNGET